MTETERLYRRVQMMVAPVKITATDDSGPVHRLQMRVTPVETIDNVPSLHLYGVSAHAPAGSDGTAVFLTGDRSSAVVVATNNQAARLRGLKPGEVALYTDEGDYVKLMRGRIVEIKVGTRIRIECPLVELTGDLHVEGEVVRGWGTGHQVTLGQHTHKQGADAHGDGEADTDAPTSGT